MDPAFRLFEARPTPRTSRLARSHGARARRATDGAIAVRSEGVRRKVAKRAVALHVIFRPASKGIQLDHSALNVALDRLELTPAPTLGALAPGDPGVEATQRAFEGLDFSECATGVGIELPEQAFRVSARERIRVRPNDADIEKSESCGELLPVGAGLGEVLLGIEKDDSRFGSDGRHQVEQNGALRSEGRHQRSPSAEAVAGQQGPEQREPVERPEACSELAQVRDRLGSPGVEACGHGGRGTPRRGTSKDRPSIDFGIILLFYLIFRKYEVFTSIKRHLLENNSMFMDDTDREILKLLQHNAALPVAEVARRVGLTSTPCWRRIQKLEESGVIVGRVAVLDPEKINAKVNVFVSIRTREHSLDWFEQLRAAVDELAEVVEFYRMSGEVDYLLRVVVADIDAYDAFYKRLIGQLELADVSSSFAIEQIKYTTALPLEYAPRRS